MQETQNTEDRKNVIYRSCENKNAQTEIWTDKPAYMRIKHAEHVYDVKFDCCCLIVDPFVSNRPVDRRCAIATVGIFH